MKLFSIVTICSLLLLSCTNGYKFWDISKFNIVDSALSDNEEIKLFYTSRGPGNNNDLEYYVHIIAISQKTGDTVNILTSMDNGFTVDDLDKVYNYFDQNNLMSQLVLANPENLVDADKVNDAKKNLQKKITKVARDPQFDVIADNHYPTVIGTIGTKSK